MKAHFIDSQVDARATIHQLSISDFDSLKPEQNTKLDMSLVLDGVQINQEGQVISIEPGAEILINANANNLLDKPTIKADVGLNDLTSNVSLEQQGLALQSTVRKFALNEVQLDKLESLSLKMATQLGGIELNHQGKLISLVEGTTLNLDAQIHELLQQPTVKANMQLRQLDVMAEEINKHLLVLSKLDLEQLDYSSAGVGIAQLKLEGLSALNKGEEAAGLAQLGTISVKDIALPELKSLQVNEVQLSDLQVQAVLNKKQQLNRLQPVLDYFAQPVKQPDLKKKPVEETPDTSGEPFTIKLDRIVMEGDNQIYFKDNAVEPAFERTIDISQLEIKSINTADTNTYTDLLLKASMGEYSKVDIAGRIQALAKDPSGFIKGQITGVELVPLSPYAEEATGYFIRTGQLKTDLDVTLEKAELGGEVKVLLSAIKLAPGDESKIEKVKQSISMPLDTALGLLRDKNGDVTLDLPMEGNINAPDFSLASVMGQVSTKVLKKATIVGLKYMFQPYGTFITVGSWLGKKATAVRLDPLVYPTGEVELTAKHKTYLAKVAEIMKNKEGLRIKLCAQTVGAEQKALHQQALSANPQAQPPAEDKLVEMAKQRAETARDYLVETGQVEVDRLLLCQPSYDGNAEDKQSLVHLEI